MSVQVRWEQEATVFTMGGPVDDEVWATVERAFRAAAGDTALAILDVTDVELGAHDVTTLDCLVARLHDLEVRVVCRKPERRRDLRDHSDGRLQALPSLDHALADPPRRSHQPRIVPEEVPAAPPARPAAVAAAADVVRTLTRPSRGLAAS